MHAINVIFVVGWVVFWLGWLAAATNAKSGRSRFGRYAGVRIVVVLVFIGAGRIHALRRPASSTRAVEAVGLVLFVLGLAVAVWARVHLGRNWGTPMSEKEDPDLITTGPYRWVRNPIYSGLIMAMIGTSIAANLDWLLFTVPLTGYFIYSAVMEQRYMTATFPDTYPAYRDSTKMLIPFIV
jgi:protein-S-isoprenylcysteine O-methyltransferase Ste14